MQCLGYLRTHLHSATTNSYGWDDYIFAHHVASSRTTPSMVPSLQDEEGSTFLCYRKRVYMLCRVRLTLMETVTIHPFASPVISIINHASDFPEYLWWASG